MRVQLCDSALHWFWIYACNTVCTSSYARISWSTKALFGYTCRFNIPSSQCVGPFFSGEVSHSVNSVTTQQDRGATYPCGIYINRSK
jgi:hypothetical protein